MRKTSRGALAAVLASLTITDNTWRQKACSPTKKLKPGGGSSNRTVARHDCADTVCTSWRNHVDVDVDGEIDTAEQPMNQAAVNCRVR